jgi:hypothetical protein
MVARSHNHSQAVDPRGMENSGPAAKHMRRLVVHPCQYHGRDPSRLAAAQPKNRDLTKPPQGRRGRVPSARHPHKAFDSAAAWTP